jgi:hypothetical protein
MKKNISRIKMYPFPPSSFHLFIYLGGKKTLTSTPLPLNSTTKKGKKRRRTRSPLLLPPFHISRGKKNINLDPPPPQQKKKKEKNQGAPFPPSHNEYNINPGPSQQ